MSSMKNRNEHAVVARTLRGRLAPLCLSLDVPDAPRLMKVRNVHHLYTPITGTLRPEVGPIELAAALHPTPAVGGYPEHLALRFIRARERLDRGWYAGPFGWVDGRGNGDFAVALRSALLDQPVGSGFARAHLYAGCGIVADSVPRAEHEESCLKLRPMLAALGGGT
jgi:salicylate biosynthesis isochorismate synthase